MPIIEGGTYRVWPRTQDLRLSAEQSYDPNMDPDNQSLLHYHWGCQSTSKVKAHMKQKSLPHIITEKESYELFLTRLTVSVLTLRHNLFSDFFFPIHSTLQFLLSRSVDLYLNHTFISLNVLSRK